METPTFQFSPEKWPIPKYRPMGYFANEEPPKRLGAAHPTLVPYQAFMCQDGKYINVAVGSERIWERFCRGMKMPEMKENPDYATNGDRVNHRNQIVPYLQDIFLKRPVNDWVKDLQEVNVPCGPINDLADVFSDPQLLHREMFVEMAHPTMIFLIFRLFSYYIGLLYGLMNMI